MTNFTWNSNLNSHDFLLVTKNYSAYTDLKITRSMESQIPQTSSKSNSFGKGIKLFFMGR